MRKILFIGIENYFNITVAEHFFDRNISKVTFASKRKRSVEYYIILVGIGSNFKKIMSVWWILTLLIPWLAIWAYMTFLA